MPIEFQVSNSHACFFFHFTAGGMFQLFTTVDITCHKYEVRFPILPDKQNLSSLLIDNHHTHGHIVHRETILLTLRAIRNDPLTF